jgi:hypothetical protein
MLDRKRNLNKLILSRKKAQAKKARRIKSSHTQNHKDHQPTALVTGSRPQEATRSHLTDTEALTRKVRADLVRDAQAAFAAVMTELNASQNNAAPDETETSAEDAEESDDAIVSHRLIQIDRVGEA